MHNPMVEGFVQISRLGGEHSVLDLNACAPQHFEAPAGVKGIWIDGGDHNFPDVGSFDRVGAGWCSSVGRARFECDVESRAANAGLARVSVLNRGNLGMSFSGSTMPAAANDLAVPDENCADHWVGGGRSVAAFGQS